jgi:aspartyl-tRNA synthetase
LSIQQFLWPDLQYFYFFFLHNFFSALTGELEGIGPLVSSLEPEKKEQLTKLLGTKAGDLILFALGEQSSANRILGRLRLFIAHKLEVIDKVSLKLTRIDTLFVNMFKILHMRH